MIEELKIEIAALKQRRDDLCFLLIEAEGEEYFSYATELEHVEHEIELKEQRIYNNERTKATS